MIPNFKISRIVFWTICALIAGLLLTAVAARRQYTLNAGRAQGALTAIHDGIAEDLPQKIGLYQYGLRGARGTILTAGESGLTRQIFNTYSKTRDIKAEFPGARGFGFIRRVPQDEEARFLEQARRDGAPNFSIRQLTPHNGERYVIQYIEPVEDNLEAVGLDIASETNRREAADAALRTGQPTLTGPITLVQSPEQGPQSFLLLMPVYKQALPSGVPGNPERTALGWTYAPLSISDVLGSLVFDRAMLRLSLIDVTNEDRPIPFYDTASGAMAGFDALSVSKRVPVYGRLWRVEMYAGPQFIQSLHQFQPLWVLGAGGAASLLFAAFVAVVNISRQRRDFAAAERARLATIVENSSDPIVGQALDGTIMSWNQAAERHFGYTATEVLGRSFADLLIPPEDRKQDSDLLARIAHGDIVAPFDAVHLHRDGTRFEMSITAGVVRDPSGRIVGFGKLLRDIGAQKREERRLVDSNSRLEEEVSARTAELTRSNTLLANVLESASEVAIIATDPEGVIQIFNAGAERMLGYVAEEMVGKQTPAIIHLAEEVEARGVALTAEYGVPVQGFRVFVHVPEIAGAETREWTYRRKDGGMLRVSLVATAMRDADGHIVGYLGIAQDVTERHRHMAELEGAKVVAESANVAKSQFLAMMSHELRTPMAGVLGMAELLLTSDLQHDQQRQVQTLMRSAHTLLGLLNDILDFAKIEANRVDLEQIDFSLQRLVEDVGAVLSPLASERGNAVQIDMDPTLLPAYRGDAKRYRQVLMNLTGNANKFTVNGDVSIVLCQRAMEDGKFIVETSVADTGVGIAPDSQTRLFQPFVQESAATSRKFGGTGLGLAISKRLVELMGGKISFDSRQGVGSTFTFTVVLRRGDINKVEAVADAMRRTSSGVYVLPTSVRPLRILAAEDNDTNRMLLTTLLGRIGHSVDAVENGALAVAALEQGSYDIVLMDMQMPVMDGVEATRAIREAGKTMPIIALTADALPENHHRYLDAGVDSIITKPINWQLLADEMDRMTGARRRASDIAALQAPDHAATEQRVVDTIYLASLAEAIGRETLEQLLESFGISVGGNLSDLAVAVNEGDMNAAVKAAHSLKGVASQFGVPKLAAVARDAEKAASSGHLTVERVSEMRTLTDKTLSALKAWVADQYAAT